MRGFIFHLNELYQKGSTLKILDELLRNETLSRKQIEEIQWEKLTALLRNAYEYVPYYRNRWKKMGLHPRDIRHFDDFREKVPFISKDDVQEHFDAFLSENPGPGVYRVHTSGTSGVPAHFLRDGLSRSYGLACRYRGRHWWGVRPIDTEVRFWGRTAIFSPSIEVKLKDKLKRLKDRLSRVYYCSTFRMTDKELESNRRLILRVRPRIILGYSSALFAFSRYLKDCGYNLLDSGIEVVTYTSEPLYPFQKEFVQEVFCEHVTSEYGSVENGIVGFECPEGSLHVMDDDVYLESCTVEDEEDQLIVTNLNAYSFPLIRYRMEDVGTISDKMCRCGRPLRVMHLNQSRVYDCILKHDGSCFVPVHFHLMLQGLLESVRGCRRYQLIQHELDKIEIKVETSQPLSDKIRKALELSVKKIMGKDVHVQINEYGYLDVERSGKFKFIISRLVEGGHPGL